MTFICQKKETADGHDAGLESAESHFLVAGSAADARDAGLVAGECHPVATRTAADAHAVNLKAGDASSRLELQPRLLKVDAQRPELDDLAPEAWISKPRDT